MDEAGRTRSTERGVNEITHLGDYSLSDADREVVDRLTRLRPGMITDLQERIAYLSLEETEYKGEIPDLIKFLGTYNDLSQRADSAGSLPQMNLVMRELREINNDIFSRIKKRRKDDPDEIDCFGSTTYSLIEEEIHKLDRKRKKADMQNFAERFRSPLPEKIFNLFVVKSDSAPGLKQSIQGTMAASQILSTDHYRDILKGELNLAYPGSGGHLTPLIMAFDLIERKCIERANFILNDKDDMTSGVDQVLKYLLKENAVGNLSVGYSDKDPDQRVYSFLYNNKQIRIYCFIKDFYDVADWNPGGAPLNVVYDHLPFQSAFAGSASMTLSESVDLIGGHKIAYIYPGDKAAASIIRSGKIIRSDVIENVSFADKGDWVVGGDRGIGLTVVAVNHEVK